MKSIRIGVGCSVRNKSGIYYALFYDRDMNPKRREISLRTGDVSVAVPEAKTLFIDWKNGSFDPWNKYMKGIRLLEAASLYEKAHMTRKRKVSIDSLLFAVRALAAKYGDLNVSRIPASSLFEFVYRADLAPATRRGYWRRLNVFFNWCVSEGMVQVNPMTKIERPKDVKPVPKYYSEDQVERLVGAVALWVEEKKGFNKHTLANPLWLEDVIDLIARTGLRRAEASRLVWGDVHLDAPVPFLVVTSKKSALTKSGHGRTVTLSPAAMRRLLIIQDKTRNTSHPEEAVLKNAAGDKGAAMPYAGKKFRQLCKFAGLPCHGLHGLRHTFAFLFLSAGGTMRLLQSEMGHSDLKSTMIYSSLAVEDRLQLVSNIWNK